jgi:hypothetical protein
MLYALLCLIIWLKQQARGREASTATPRPPPKDKSKIKNKNIKISEVHCLIESIWVELQPERKVSIWMCVFAARSLLASSDSLGLNLKSWTYFKVGSLKWCLSSN